MIHAAGVLVVCWCEVFVDRSRVVVRVISTVCIHGGWIFVVRSLDGWSLNLMEYGLFHAVLLGGDYGG